jgi:hypothetical protein
MKSRGGWSPAGLTGPGIEAIDQIQKRPDKGSLDKFA